MGVANKSVVLYQSIKIGNKWVLRPVDEDSSYFSVGPFYVSWYDGKKKMMVPVGPDPEHALRKANLKRIELAYVSAGGEVNNTDQIQKPQARGSAEHEVKNSQPQPLVGDSTESEGPTKIWLCGNEHSN